MSQPKININSGGGPKPLPMLRSDVRVYRGPLDPDGSPTYNVKDPVTGRFYKFNWEQGLILKSYKPGISAEQLALKVSQGTTVHLSAEDVITFFEDLGRYGLLNVPRTSDHVHTMDRMTQVGWVKWLALHYLYIRIPLLNPDRFLSATVGYVRPLASRLFLTLVVLITCIGLFRLTQRLDEFLSTFNYFFNFQGLLIYGLVLTGIKVVHEFSHAYTAKNYGVHVPSMGIVLLVFWPVLYTDVTDGWKLYSRHRRLAISLAGIAAELVIAGLATFAWTVSEPGVWQSVFFVIASSTWLSTLAVNLNPAMRFDGYYILGDIWGIENLQQRAFAVTRWKLHQLFLGINVRPPEEGLTKQRITGMAVYSIYTWIYRVFLYVAIALLVYYKFAKIIGILLFALEIALFFVWPIVSEAQILYALRSQIHWNPRTLATSTAIALFVAWSLLPLPQRVEYQAVVVPVEEQLILVPRSSTVAEIFVNRGDHVNVGDPIVRLQDPKLDTDIAVTQLDVDALEWQIEQGNIDATSQPYIAEKRSELQSTRARLASLLAIRETLLVRATVSGVLHEWYDSIRPGIALTHKSELGRIADSSQVKAIAFVPEKDLERYRLYSNSSFRVRSPIQTVDGELRPLRFVRSQTLEYIALASTYQGNLPVSERNDGTLELVESFFPVELDIKDSESTLRFGQSGVVVSRTQPSSPIMRLYRAVHSTLLKESGI